MCVCVSMRGVCACVCVCVCLPANRIWALASSSLFEEGSNNDAPI